MLLETIRLFNGKLQNIAAHNQRSSNARKALLGIQETWDLGALIEIPDYAKKGLWKCRVLYGEKIESIDFQPYTVKKITSIQLVAIHNFDYTYKYADRFILQKTVERTGADDVLFVQNDLVTDLSYANIAFFDGLRWWTPEKPLLEGTRRGQLLRAGRIFTKHIRVSDILTFQAYRPINAMLQFERTDKGDISVFRF